MKFDDDDDEREQLSKFEKQHKALAEEARAAEQRAREAMKNFQHVRTALMGGNNRAGDVASNSR